MPCAPQHGSQADGQTRCAGAIGLPWRMACRRARVCVTGGTRGVQTLGRRHARVRSPNGAPVTLPQVTRSKWNTHVHVGPFPVRLPGVGLRASSVPRWTLIRKDMILVPGPCQTYSSVTVMPNQFVFSFALGVWGCQKCQKKNRGCNGASKRSVLKPVKWNANAFLVRLVLVHELGRRWQISR
jgi:hypothetical protein